MFLSFSHKNRPAPWGQARCSRCGVGAGRSTAAAKGQGLPHSYVDVSAENVALETVKKAEDSDSTMIRLYEFQNRRTEVTVKLADAFSKVEECDLMENPEAEIPTDGHSFTFTVKPYEIKTFRLTK